MEQAPSTADLAREVHKACRDPGVTKAPRVIRGLLDRRDVMGPRAHRVHVVSRAQWDYMACLDLGDQWDQKDPRD